MQQYDFVRRLDTRGIDKPQPFSYRSWSLLTLLVLCVAGLLFSTVPVKSLFYVKRQAVIMFVGF